MLPVPKEEIVYLNLADLHPFKNHPFGVRDDAEMQGLVESVKAAGVNQPALVRPREDGGYEIIAGHRRQRESELAGFANMPCIKRNKRRFAAGSDLRQLGPYSLHLHDQYGQHRGPWQLGGFLCAEQWNKSQE
ncbi:MAG: ParB N-terminal domain-containing protein [Oscillospiraceae bacterium]